MEYSLASLLFYAFKEGACSEQSARMTAMDGASKNAGLFHLFFNRYAMVNFFDNCPGKLNCFQLFELKFS
jgi:hypothetical protein